VSRRYARLFQGLTWRSSGLLATPSGGKSSHLVRPKAAELESLGSQTKPSCDDVRFSDLLASSQVVLSSRLGFASGRNDKENELHTVRTISIGKVEGLKPDDRFLAELSHELAKRSFAVTTHVENADAPGR